MTNGRKAYSCSMMYELAAEKIAIPSAAAFVDCRRVTVPYTES